LLATYRGYPEMIESLLASKADPNLKSDEGAVPLFNVNSCSLPQSERNRLIALLLEHGAKVGATVVWSGRESVTLLMQAASSGNKELVELLLAHKANPNAKSKAGLTTLHFAAESTSYGGSRAEIAGLLLAAGADINALDDYGRTPLKSVTSGPLSSSSESYTREFADLLRQHGAVEQMPDFTSIRLTRKELEQPILVFRKDTNSLNRFTLLEVIENYYQNPSSYEISSRSSMPGGIPTPGAMSPGGRFPFPDLGSIRIHRPIPGKPGEEKVISVVLPSGTNSIACEKDVPLEFGDVVEIPEREHSLAEGPVFLTAQQGKEIYACLSRKVTFAAKGQRAEVTLHGIEDTRLAIAMKDSQVQAILRFSSDLTRVRVTRTDPETKKTKQITENVLTFWENKDSSSNDLWLRDGDVDEVPEKQGV
jgi:hypothetical protein